MKRSRVLPVVVAAVAVVIAVFLWFRHRGHDGAGGAGAKNRSGQLPAPTVAQADRTESSRQAGALPLLIDDDPIGTLRLEGQVLDESGSPAAGVSVVVSSNPSRTVVTEGDGSFVFDHMVARPFTLLARGAKGVAGPVTAKLTAKSEPVILHLRAGTKVDVTVVSPKGAPVDAAIVELRGNIDVQSATTTKDGAAHFAMVVPGGYDVIAWAPGFAKSYQFAAVSGASVAVKLALRAGAPVSGRVLADGKPVAGARVVYYGASDWNTQADERRDGAVTDGSGLFHFDALAAGTVRFDARHEEYAPGTSAMITLDGVHPKDGVEIKLNAGATISGTVVDLSDKPVPAARIRIGERTRGMFADPPRQAFSDELGHFELHGLPRRELDVVALHDTGTSDVKPIDATTGDVKDLTLKIDITGTISGTVVDPNGQALEGIQVSAGPSFGRGGGGGRDRGDMSGMRLRGFPQELTDAAGHFTLSGLSVGKYMISASRSRSRRGGGGFGGGFGGRDGGVGDEIEAETGTKDVTLTLAPEGKVKGKIAFVDGTSPALFIIGVGGSQQSFSSVDGTFELDGVTPNQYSLDVRGTSFDSTSFDVTVSAGLTADVGLITVTKGRSIGGTVTMNGQPVAGATVYAGRQVMGSGSASSSQMNAGPLGRGTKSATTGDDGSFSLSGFAPGDLTVVAEMADTGRSKSLLLLDGDPTSDSLVIVLLPVGSISGTLVQNKQPAPGIIVAAQSTTTPGSIYSVASGPDGAYRFDSLAPDTYKVSATLGSPRTGMKFFSQEVAVASGQEQICNLTMDEGTATVVVMPTAANGVLGVASVWLANGTITAATEHDLSLKIAAAGAGHSQWQILGHGGNAEFDSVSPGTYSACAVVFPSELHGGQAMQYGDRHASALPAFCAPVTVAADATTVNVPLAVVIPALIADPQTNLTPGSHRGSSGGNVAPPPGPPPGEGPGGPPPM